MKNWSFVLIFVALFSSGQAQTPEPNASPGKGARKPELPVGPLLRDAPSFSEWVMTYAYPKEAAKPAATAADKARQAALSSSRPSKVTTTKTGVVVHETVLFLDNSSTEKWFEGNIQYYQNANAGIWFEASPFVRGGDSHYAPLPANGFRDLDWINAANYVCSLPYNGGSCLLFVPGGYRQVDLSDPNKLPTVLAAQAKVAYIDVDTRMPVALREGLVTRMYQFNPVPTGMQTLPADLSKSIVQGNEQRRRLAQSASRPY